MKNTTNSYQKRMANNYLAQWKQSSDTQLSDVYGRYSKAKEKAFDYCQELYYELDGKGFRIITHNLNIFTAGFSFFDKEDGNKKFMAITPSYNAVIDYIS